MTTWLEDRKNKLAITTYGGYQQEIDRIARYFRQHNLYIEQIDEIVITNFYRYNRRHGLSENTLLHYQTIMNQTLRKAVKEKLIPLNPYAVLDQDVKPSHTHFAPETYDIADLEQLFTAMQGDPLALFILMDVTYGLRRSELLGLKWSAIDFENKRYSALARSLNLSDHGGHLHASGLPRQDEYSQCRNRYGFEYYAQGRMIIHRKVCLRFCAKHVLVLICWQIVGKCNFLPTRMGQKFSEKLQKPMKKAKKFPHPQTKVQESLVPPAGIEPARV